MNDFYVDDWLKSLEEEENGIKLAAQLCELMSKGGFKLAKWVSNSHNLLFTIMEEDRAKQDKGLNLNFEVLPAERVLGVCWGC